MKCLVPGCTGNTKVADSRKLPEEEGVGIKRTRECTTCGMRYGTEERPTTDAYVKSHGGDRKSPHFHRLDK